MVAKLGHGRTSDGKTGLSKGMDDDSCPTDLSTARVLSCSVVKGPKGDVDADPGKLPLMPELQAPWDFLADT